METITLLFVTDKTELEQALEFLEKAAITNLPEFVKTLSDILRHGGNSPVARMAAGLQLKNQLTSKDQNIRTTYQHRWLAFPEEIRNYIKNNVSFVKFILLLSLQILTFAKKGIVCIKNVFLCDLMYHITMETHLKDMCMHFTTSVY